jgi:hypothetical protein
MESPETLARFEAELRAHNAERDAQKGTQTPPPAAPEPSTPPASPRGWLGGIFKRPSK